jgi:hypothetical protein
VRVSQPGPARLILCGIHQLKPERHPLASVQGRNELCQLDREEENLADGHLGYIEFTPLDEFRNSSNRNEKYLERQVVTFTVAFGTSAPVGSVTTPVMDPNNP